MTLALISLNLRDVVKRGIGVPRRPSLLAATAATAGVAAIANAVAMAAPPAAEAPTRLGTSLTQSMRDRDRTLNERNRALDLREQATRAAEQRLRNDLQTNQPAVDAAAQTVPGQAPANPQDAVYGNLARIYQTMKPNKAAPIFERLALDVQVQVAKRMREGQTAQIMAAMAPDSAVELSMALAGRQVVKAPPPPIVVPRQNAVPQPAARRRGAPVAASAIGRGVNTSPATRGGAPAARSAAPAPDTGGAGKAAPR